MVSVISEKTLTYPEAEDFYSPDEQYPEYRFRHIARVRNPVYRAVRDCFKNAALDEARFGTPEWNPLGKWIHPGTTVFVLCNFVYHRRLRETNKTFWGKCTHGAVVRAVVDYVLIATGPTGRISVGNAPLQSCNWEQVLADTGAAKTLRFYQDNGMPVEARDLRLYVAERGFLGQTTKLEKREVGGCGVDLKDQSLLSNVSLGGSAGFRVSEYDHRKTETFHDHGSHRYVVNQSILNADTVVSIPKLKTHEKVGITCGLKGFVGTVGHKDCLAHHRFGSPKNGGDEYPDGLRIRSSLSRFSDWVYEARAKDRLGKFWQILDRTMKRFLRRGGAIQTGAWHGNDTCWRMALDLARIVHFASRVGQMANQVQRNHLMLLDGVFAGEGDGPLDPISVHAGTLLFSSNVAMGDRIACRLMGYDPQSLPIVEGAFLPSPFPLYSTDPTKEIITINGTSVEEKDVNPVLLRAFLPPVGWKNHLLGDDTTR